MKLSMTLPLHLRDSRFGLLITLGVIMGLTQTGCSDAGGYTPPPNLTIVFGKVTLDGKPLAAATVNFVPTAKTSGTGGFAVTDSEGQFDAKHYSQSHGLEPGTYYVTFSRLLMPDGNPLPDGQSAADVGALESLPIHLTEIQPGPRELTFEVTPEPRTATFELTSKMKR